jgi:hypothetical protein
MERAPETAAPAGQAGRRVGDNGPPQSRSQPRGVFEVDEDGALAELERAWADHGYHGFCILEHVCGARSAPPARCSRTTRRTGWTSRPARTDGHCGERIGSPGGVPGKPLR